MLAPSVMRSSSFAQPSSSFALDPPQSHARAGSFGSIVTAILLAGILGAAPIGLGSARLWYELPLLLVVALLVVVQGIRLSAGPRNGRSWRMDAADLAVVAFTLYAVFRWLSSPTEYFSRLEVLNVFAYGAIFFSCRYGLTRRVHALALLWVPVILAVGEVGFGYYLHQHNEWTPFGRGEDMGVYYAPRWIGTYGCPDHLGSLLVMATGAALALGAFSKLPWPVRIICFYLAGMSLAGLVCSFSRGGWLSFFASVGALTFFGLRHGGLRWWVPLTSAILLLGAFSMVLYLSPVALARVQEPSAMLQSGTLNDYCRIELDRDALRISRDYPGLGTGPATFIFVHPRYQSSTFAFKAMLTHDDYLNCLDDYGWIGFGLALFFIGAVTLAFLRPLPVDNRWQDRVLTAAGLAAWSALLVHSAVDFNLHIPANALMLFGLTGLGLRGVSRGDALHPRSSLSLGRLSRGLGWVVILAGLAYLAQVGRTAMSDLIYEAALRDSDIVPFSRSIQGAQDALSYDRGNAQALAFLGDLYRYQGSRKKTIEERVADGQNALNAYQSALKASPLDDTIQGRIAMTFDVMRRYSEAFFSYKKALEAQPYNGQFWYQLGNHYWQRGLLIKAEEAYLRGAACPHGAAENVRSETELRKILDAYNIPKPASGTDPLHPREDVEPSTTP